MTQKKAACHRSIPPPLGQRGPETSQLHFALSAILSLSPAPLPKYHLKLNTRVDIPFDSSEGLGTGNTGLSNLKYRTASTPQVTGDSWSMLGGLQPFPFGLPTLTPIPLHYLLAHRRFSPPS